MNVLMTGGSGFVGSNLVRHFLRTEPSYRIHLWLRNSSDLWRLSDIADKITIHHVDMTDCTAMRNSAKSIQPDCIYHFANAGVYGGRAAAPQELFRVNTLGFLNLLEALEDIQYRALINVGSSSEYGSKEAPMRESDVCEPENFYGISKLSATLSASLYARLHDRPIATFRLFSPYGPFDDARRLVPRTILACMRKENFTLPHPQSVRDYIFIDDVIALLVEAASHLGEHSGEVFNVGGGREVHALAVVYTIADFLHERDFVGSLAQYSGDQALSESPRWEADMTRTYAAFAWRPTTSMQTGLEQTVAWFKQHAIFSSAQPSA